MSQKISSPNAFERKFKKTNIPVIMKTFKERIFFIVAR